MTKLRAMICEGMEAQEQQNTGVSFSNFVMGLATAAMANMGLVEDPTTGKKTVQLSLAKQHIEILEMFDEKTKGNLTKEEQELIAYIVPDLKMKYVQSSDSAKKE